MARHAKRSTSPGARGAGWLAALALMVASGCATAGANPHEMTALDHEKAAAYETEMAQKQEAQFDENAWSSAGGCNGSCFGTWSNPTSEHARAAMKHRARAKRHERTAKTMRRTDARAAHRAGAPAGLSVR